MNKMFVNMIYTIINSTRTSDDKIEMIKTVLEISRKLVDTKQKINNVMKVKK